MGYIIKINPDELVLEEAIDVNPAEIEEFVDGHCEILYNMFSHPEILIVCDEEAALTGLPISASINKRILLGALFVCGMNKSEEDPFRPLTQAEAEAVQAEIILV